MLKNSNTFLNHYLGCPLPVDLSVTTRKRSDLFCNSLNNKLFIFFLFLAIIFTIIILFYMFTNTRLEVFTINSKYKTIKKKCDKKINTQIKNNYKKKLKDDNKCITKNTCKSIKNNNIISNFDYYNYGLNYCSN